MSLKPIGFHPGARSTDPDTSHEASDAKDHGRAQADIIQDVDANGPGTEETILNRMGVPRTSASSQISTLVRNGYLVDIVDPRTQKKITLRNISGCRARVRGLPKHQRDTALITALQIRMDNESDGNLTVPPKPVLGTARVSGPSTERRQRERRQRERRKALR
jgi:hypothetical protein